MNNRAMKTVKAIDDSISAKFFLTLSFSKAVESILNYFFDKPLELFGGWIFVLFVTLIGIFIWKDEWHITIYNFVRRLIEWIKK